MSSFSVRKPLTIFVAAIAVMAIGIISYVKLTPDLLPNMDYPYIIVVTTYPGATPEQVEEVITKPAEQSLATLSGVKNISSTSGSNYSMIAIEFTSDTDMGTITADVVQNLNLVEGTWEDDMIGTPTIMKINPSMIPVNATAVTYDGKDTREVSQFVDSTLVNQLEGTDGIASVTSYGMVDTDINVVLNQDKIDAINTRLVSAVSEELAAGTAQINAGEKKVSEARKQLAEQQKNVAEQESKTYNDLASASAALDSAKAYESSLQAEMDSLKAWKSILVAQNNELKKQMKELSAIPGATEELEKIVTENETEIAKAEARIAILTEMKKGVTSQVGDADKAYSETIKGGYNAVGGFATAKTQLSQAEEALDNSEAQLKEARAQLEEAQSSALEQANMGELLNMNTISGILQAQNFSMPAGYAKMSGGDVLVGVGDKFSSLDDIKNLVLVDTGVDGVGKIRLSDVASVFMTDNENEIYASLNGEPGVLLTFNKQSDAATSTACENLTEKFETLEGKYDGLHFSMLFDQGYYIRLVINAILESLLFGALFAMMIVFLFLREVKPTIIIMTSIPLSLIFAVALMYFSGVSINLMSMAGLAVAVGMLVDNSIVVLENTIRLRREGVPAKKAAVAGAKQVTGAVTASTLTTICVFAPIVFIDGITREMFTDLALTIVYSLLASLLVALTLIPAMASTMLEKVRQPKEHSLDKLKNFYERVLNLALGHKAITLLLALLLLVGSLFASISKGFIFMPDMSSPEIEITLENEDASFDEITAMSDEAVEKIMAIEDIETVGAMISNGSTSGLTFGEDSSEGYISMYVLMKDESKRKSYDVCKEIEETLSGLDCEVQAGTVGSVNTYMEMLGGSGISLYLYGEDQKLVQDTAEDIAGIVSSVQGVDEVDDGLQDLDNEIHFTVDKSKAAAKGLTVAQVYQAMSTLIAHETESTSVNIGGVDYDLMVKDSGKSTWTVDKLKKAELSITGADGKTVNVKVSDVATVNKQKALSTINRYNQKRYLTVTATAAEGKNITLLQDDIEAALETYDLPEGVNIEYSGLDETIMDAMKKLGLMILMAILLVYLIMVAQFQSLKAPFIIMFTIPLAFTGGALMLLICGMEISVISMVGFVMLVGIIVNNGIVLIDYVNQLRGRGMAKKEALLQGGLTRMRPVLMTSMTTILGLSIMAFGTTAGTDMMQPVALVSIGGLVYATLLTLVVVPVIYDLLHKEEFKVIRKADLDVTDILESQL